jgi:hypothetical protein
MNALIEKIKAYYDTYFENVNNLESDFDPGHFMDGIYEIVQKEQARIIKDLKKHTGGPDDYGYYTVDIEDAIEIVKDEKE